MSWQILANRGCKYIHYALITLLKAVEEDKDYLSAYFSQEATLSFFYQQLKFGEMPTLSHS